VRVGESLVLLGDMPMTLVVTGSRLRQSLVLILHEATQRAGTAVDDWKPSGLCQQ
jgi:hypothetical protein